MIEVRLKLDPSYTQRLTTELLFIMGLISMPSAPIIGHLADKTTSRKIPLIISLIGCTIGTILVATTLNRTSYTSAIDQGRADSAQYISSTLAVSCRVSLAQEPGSLVRIAPLLYRPMLTSLQDLPCLRMPLAQSTWAKHLVQLEVSSRQAYCT